MLGAYLALTVAECRTAKRLPSVWVLVSISAVVTWISYTFYLLVHTSYSSVSLAAGNASPRYAFAYYNVYLIWFLMGTLILFADRVFRLDREEMIAESLHSRPVSNAVFLGGKLTALTLTVWLPLLFVVSLIQAFGAVGSFFGWPGLAFSRVSWFAMLFSDALPTFFFWTSLLLLLAALYRSRFAFYVTAFVLLGCFIVADSFVPNYLLPATSLASSYDGWSSDLAPRLSDNKTLVHRSALLAFGAGFFTLAAAVYGRRDDASQIVRILLATVLVIFASCLVAAVVSWCLKDLSRVDGWREAHLGAATEVPSGDDRYQIPDVVAVVGDVGIDPGENLAIDLSVSVRLKENDGSPLLFSLNPGIVAASVTSGGAPLPFSQRAGLLYIDQPRGTVSDADFGFRLRATGKPDVRFAHLDAPVDWQRQRRSNRMKQLGTSAGLFHDDYVALTPAIAWLPMAGPSAAVGKVNDDSFKVRLQVSAPDGWTVASPGARPVTSTVTHIAPRVPVRRLALFASGFHKETAEIAGVTINLLLHPDHQQNVKLVDVFGGRGALEDQAATVFSGLEKDGLSYPFSTLHLVEVPSYLRMYGGGLRLGAANSPPGILLMREQGIPNARLAWRHRQQQPESDDPAGLAVAVASNITTLLNANDSPENMTRGLARLVSVDQTPAQGAAASVLNLICEELATLLLSPDYAATEPAFSAHSYNREIPFGATLVGMFQGVLGTWTNKATFYSPWLSRPTVWELAEKTAVGDIHLGLARTLPPLDAQQQTIQRPPIDAELLSGVLELKGKAAARYLYDFLGRTGTAALLSTLRERFADVGFELSDLQDVVAKNNPALATAIGLWLEQAELPGFRVSTVDLFALPGVDTPGAPRFAARVHVRNTEGAVGFFQLSTSPFEPDRGFGPVTVPGHAGIEVTLFFEQVPEDIWVVPYLSLNRFPIRLAIPSRTDHHIHRDVGSTHRAGAQTSRPSSWMPRPAKHIVVDDLDPGLRIEREWNWRTRLLNRNRESRELDKGLPVQPRRAGVWGRRDIPTAWGEYRRTAVGSLPGDGEASAVFRTRLPSTGEWQLDLFLPARRVDMSVGRYEFWRFFLALGVYQIDVVAGGESTRVRFDAGRAVAGWSELGRFNFVSRDVSVIVSNRTNGDVVLVDAIRWRQP